MAKTQEELQGFKQAFRNYLGRDAEQGAVDAFGGSNISLDDRVRELLSSDEFTGRARTTAQNEFAPSLNALDRTQDETTSSYDDILRQLETQQKEAPEQIFGDFNRRGLFRSSMAQTEVAKQLGEIGRKSTSARLQRASRLADLAAQRAQLITKQQQYSTSLIDQPRQQFEEQIAAREEAQQKAEAEQRKMQYEQAMQELKYQTALINANKARGGGSGSGDGDALDFLMTSLANQQNQSQQPIGNESFDPNEDFFGDDFGGLEGIQPPPPPPVAQSFNLPTVPQNNLRNVYNSLASNRTAQSLKNAAFAPANALASLFRR